MFETLAVVLSGGKGTRLYPLTKLRSKPSVPIAGKYRLLDIPLSNCLNSGVNKIFVLTQFMSESLSRHVAQTYKFDGFSNGFVQILGAEQTLKGFEWYKGTADSVRKNLQHFAPYRYRHLLVLSGDHLYRMDFRHFAARHVEKHADATVAVLPVSRARASGLGILRVDAGGRIVAFVEKPNDPAVLDSLELDTGFLDRLGFPDHDKRFLASMGIYMFRTDFLREAFADETIIDFGMDLIPRTIHTHNVQAFVHKGHWVDVGTIGAFYEANLDLTEANPKFDLFDPRTVTYTHPRFLPPTRIVSSRISRSLIADGSTIEDTSIEHSVIGLRANIRAGTSISRTIVMGADYYEDAPAIRENMARGVADVGIGRNCRIDRAIIDKNARIGDGVIITQKGSDHDTELYSVRDGIVVIPKNAVIPAGMRI